MKKQNRKNKQADLIKILAPRKLKKDLVSVANSRNISLSALARIALTEYIKNKN